MSCYIMLLMTPLRLLYAGLILPVFLLPLVCLCQFVPGQATASPPHLLLTAETHVHGAASAISDEQLADIAFATGLPVMVDDLGNLQIGFSDELQTITTNDCAFSGNPNALEASPQLSASLPPAIRPLAPRAVNIHVAARPLATGQHTPQPLEQPPPAA